jgi:hypothetical protein
MLFEQPDQLSINIVTSFTQFADIYEGFFGFVLVEGVFDT